MNDQGWHLRAQDDATNTERAGIYAFLATVFASTPTQETVQGVCDMAKVLGIRCPDGLLLDELQREFLELFVIPNPRYVAPYESVYRDAYVMPRQPSGSQPADGQSFMVKGLLMGESTLAVQRCYEEAGVAAAEDLPDHIVNELRLLAYLWTHEEDQTEIDGAPPASRRVRFRDEHLLKWIGQLRDRILESERLGFYSAAIEVSEFILRSEP
jgi:TorA maturation chaperone TorD